MGKLEVFRGRELVEGDPLHWHPLNQKMAKDLQDRRGRGESPKVERAKAKRDEEQRRHDEYMRNFPVFQFNRAIGRLLDQKADKGTIGYLANNTDKFDNVVDESGIDVGNGNVEERAKRRVIATVVDFTRINVPPKEEESDRENPLEQERLAS